MDARALTLAMSNSTDEEKEALMQQLKNMAIAPYDKEKFLASITSETKRVKFSVLHDIQDKVDELQEQFAKERKALELKYRSLCGPLYVERSGIVSGKVVPPGAEDSEVGIPKFWLTCLANNDELGETITEKDSAVLEHLEDITCTHYDGDESVDGETSGKHGFMLTFTFGPNPFFDHKELTKAYLFQDDEQTVLMKSVGTDIQWKQGKDPTMKLMKKKGKGGANTKFKSEKVESFFNFFNPPTIPEDDELDPEEDEELQEAVEDDYETGATIKDKVLPMALKWYTGEAEADQGIVMMDGDDDDEDEDDEDDDDEDDGDDDDAAPVAPPTDKKEECKQQ